MDEASRSDAEAGKVLRLVLAEDASLIRESIRQLLALRDDVEVIAACEDLDQLVRAIDEHRPDVVLTDIRMPPTHTDEGIRAAAKVREIAPETGVVVLSQYVDPGYALALLERGSERRGYLLKERVADLDELVFALREVARGGSVVDPQVVDALVQARGAIEASPLDELTPREREVLAAMASGRSNAAIAEALILTERAVEKHINSIFAKLGVRWEEDVNRRVRAVLIYLAAEGGES